PCPVHVGAAVCPESMGPDAPGAGFDSVTIMNESANSGTRHVVAVVGDATAGSEIAHILAERGALVVVFEQNPRPFGKIEDGLPRWHVKQRRDEYEEINKRLDHPDIEYVPKTRMGRDFDFEA